MKVKKKTTAKKNAKSKIDLDDRKDFAKNFDKLMARYMKKMILKNASGSAE